MLQPEGREDLVKHAVLGGVVHQLPEQGDDEGGGEVRQEVERAEEDLATRNLREEDGQNNTKIKLSRPTHGLSPTM